MNINFDISIVTAMFQRVARELREKRLWPVAAALLVAIVAVPVVLLKSSGPAPVAPGPQATPPPSAATSLPTLNVQTTPAQSRLTGRARDPFTQQSSGTTGTSSTTATSTATATSSTSTSSAATGGSSAAQGSVGGAGGGAVSTATPVTPRPITVPSTKPKPSAGGLTATQSYDVSLAITNASGGLNTIDPLERLSVLPDNKHPLLVELGVLQGGHRVLFAVQPGTTVSGPGKCTPGRIDCEILSLGVNQTESLATQTPTGAVPGPLFAVTGITAANHASAAAAARARRAESPAGRALLSRSSLSALSLFQYEPGVGAVVDRRNLSIRGN
jgi:hypothetical protein